jgi:hypothetical protein
MKRKILFALLFVVSFSILRAQNTFNPDTVKAQKYDTGTMWAFEYPPFEYLKQVYNFTPTQEWFDDVRLSALSLGGCSASFVSNDGLLMTNNHCARGYRRAVQKPGEDLEKTGFIALTLEEERKVPNFRAQQLRFLKDVSKEVLSAMKAGKTEKEKIALRDTCTRQLARKYTAEQNLTCRVVSYYNGGVYYVQGYKVYTDIRYVFQPEEQTASFGGDPDNFTYPRYALDIALFRVYENDKPIKSEHFFQWSAEGAAPGELIFTVGTPGTTNRLRTVAQLEYMRDIQYRNSTFQMDNLYKKLDQLKAINPANAADYERQKLQFSNGWKSATYTYKALNDPYLMARKKAFEKKIQDAVMKDPVLKKEFGHVWKTIEVTRKELKGIDSKLAAYTGGQYASRYQTIANALVTQARLAKRTRAEVVKDSIEALQRGGGGRMGGGRPGGPGGQQALYPANFDPLVEKAKLEIAIDFITLNLGKNDPQVKKMFQGKTGKEIVDAMIAKSLFKSKEGVEELQKKTPDEILKLNDPFIELYAQVYDKVKDLRKKQTEVTETENVAFSLLGQIMFKIYGTSIPPDANGTLRISDGILKSYNYNGTTAPIKTTFYGLYDRFYGNQGNYPFNLAERWQNIPTDFNLNTPYDFISTNDIIGGNSGSAVINKKAEVIGLAFDGNVESMEGNFIYRDESNRTVSVDSKGIYEAIKKVYKADRIADELKSGKMIVK